jgi:hypothetical protein
MEKAAGLRTTGAASLLSGHGEGGRRRRRGEEDVYRGEGFGCWFPSFDEIVGLGPVRRVRDAVFCRGAKRERAENGTLFLYEGVKRKRGDGRNRRRNGLLVENGTRSFFLNSRDCAQKLYKSIFNTYIIRRIL